ncbi:MAG TPA: DPP IV N-terminal domain-containing protein, partial [Gemmatimonadaceae bacterium]
MRVHSRFVGSLVLLASPLAAQQPRQLSADDYARAERYLGTNTAPLVSGTNVRPTWLTDGRFWYRSTVPNGTSFVLVDPVRATRVSAFDQTRLAAALATASGTKVDGNQLPIQALELSRDNRKLNVSVQGRRWSCDLKRYVCTADTTAAAPRGAPPPNSSVSPDGKWAVYIKDYNLWGKDLTSNQETQLTTDGIKDFGYATNNAGWVHSDRPVVTWSADSRQIATFQHDGRGVRDMHLVATNVGPPRIETWKYPMPGDSVI